MFKKIKSVYFYVLACCMVSLPTFASTEGDPTDAIFDAIDLSGLSAKIIALGIIIIGIAMAFKAITIGKKAVNKA